MNPLVNPVVFFDDEKHAHSLVAGLPLAARAVQSLHRLAKGSSLGLVTLITAGGFQRSQTLKAHIVRLYPDASIVLSDLDRLDNAKAIDAFALINPAPPRTPQPTEDFGPVPTARAIKDLRVQAEQRSQKQINQALYAAGRAWVAQTTKPTDGLVSRYINRPISQAISFQLLKYTWIRPIHATLAAGAIGIAMALCLFFGGDRGLVLGAILFQIASIVDGVDGEIARATQRSSKSGATLDTATDAATNFAFLAGISANQWSAGHTIAGQAGLGAFVLLALGLTVLGWRSVRDTGALSFDALKNDARTQRSTILTGLAKITSRDVYALFLAVLVAIGLVEVAIGVFAAAVAIWFVTAMIMLARG